MGLKDNFSQINDLGESPEYVRERTSIIWRRYQRFANTNADKVFQQEYDSHETPKWFSIATSIGIKAIGIGSLYLIATEFSIEWALVVYVLYSGAMEGSDMWVEHRNEKQVRWNFHNIRKSLEKLGAYDEPKGEKHE